MEVGWLQGKKRQGVLGSFNVGHGDWKCIEIPSLVIELVPQMNYLCNTFNDLYFDPYIYFVHALTYPRTNRATLCAAS